MSRNNKWQNLQSKICTYLLAYLVYLQFFFNWLMVSLKYHFNPQPDKQKEDWKKRKKKRKYGTWAGMGFPSNIAKRFALITPDWPATAAAVLPLGELEQSPIAKMLLYFLCLMVTLSTSTKPAWSEMGLPRRQSGGPIGGVIWMKLYCKEKPSK